jgi:hypothetical protein
MLLSERWQDVLRRRQGATVDAISVPVAVIDWLEVVCAEAEEARATIDEALRQIEHNTTVPNDVLTSLAWASDSLGMDLHREAADA